MSNILNGFMFGVSAFIAIAVSTWVFVYVVEYFNQKRRR